MADKFWDNYPGPTLYDSITSYFIGDTTNPPYVLDSYTDSAIINQSTHRINNISYIYNEYIIYNNDILLSIKKQIMDAFNLYDIYVEDNTIILTLHGKNGELMGIIAAKPYGKVRRNYLQKEMNEQLHYIDYFWTHPTKRGHGLGNFLLNAIFKKIKSQHYTGKLAPVIFLKEGKPLSKLIPPLYTSTYIYKYIVGEDNNNIRFINKKMCEQIISKWIGNNTDQLYQSLNISMANRYIILWRNKAIYYITIPNQYGPNKKDKIAWITGMITVPNFKDHNIALEETAKYAAYYCETKYVWTDSQFLKTVDSKWNIDGIFHLYAFQWNPIVFGARLNGFLT